MLDARFSHLYFCQSLNRLQRGGLSAIAELLVSIYLRATAGEAGIVIYYCILSADDVLLLTPSVNALQKILHVCEKELDWLVNASKSSCMCMGLCFKVRCSNIVSISGHEITWSNDIRYLDVYFIITIIIIIFVQLYWNTSALTVAQKHNETFLRNSTETKKLRELTTHLCNELKTFSTSRK